MSAKLTMLVVAPLLLMSSACAKSTTETAPRAISDYCLITKGITYSEAHGAAETAENKYDTPDTIEQVKAHDRAYERVCPPQE